MGDPKANDRTGYRKPSLQKFTEMVVFFTQEAQPNLWKTKVMMRDEKITARFSLCLLVAFWFRDFLEQTEMIGFR